VHGPRVTVEGGPRRALIGCLDRHQGDVLRIVAVDRAAQDDDALRHEGIGEQAVLLPVTLLA
jgi:hypothetical protein